MKEYNREDEDDFYEYNNINEEKFGQSSEFNQNQIISPFRSNENSPKINNTIESKEEANKYINNNNFIMKNKIFSSFDNINDNNLQFIRYPLNDEQKKYLTPRNSTIFYKLLDFFFNW